MKWISSAEIFNIASSVSFLGLKKQVLVLLGVRATILPSILALDVCLRAKLKFNKQLLPLSIIRL
jgi:hypothetical protein